MNKPSHTIKELKESLKKALKGERYNTPPEIESEFIKLIDKSLNNTELESCTNDINFIINAYMALADESNITRKGET